MKKFVQGLIFDTDDSENWLVGVRKNRITNEETGRILLWRTPQGQWIQEHTRRGGSTSLEKLTATQAAEVFTEAITDLPDVLISDLD